MQLGAGRCMLQAGGKYDNGSSSDNFPLPRTLGVGFHKLGRRSPVSLSKVYSATVVYLGINLALQWESSCLGNGDD